MNYKIFLLSCLVFFSIGCRKKATEATKKALEDNQGISAAEFTEIKSLIQADNELSQIYNTEEAIKSFILAIADEMCKGNRSKITCPITVECCSTNNPISDKLTFDFFYENSGSMHGYICPDAKISYAVQDMMIKAEDGEKSEVNMFYINDKVYSLDKNTPFADFVGKATKDKKYEAKSSPIDNILRQVIDNTLQNSNKISFLISDYEYSTGKQNVETTLKEVERNMNKLNEKGYATLVAKFETQFLKKEKPIYIWAFGDAEKLTETIKKINLTSQRGYKNHVILSGINTKINPYYTILNYTEKEGRFGVVERGNNIIKAIEDVGFSREGRFSIGLAVDLSKIPLGNTEICNPNNYNITGTISNFKVEKITLISEMTIDHNDKSKLNSATHLIKLTLNEKLEKGNLSLKLNLNKNLPDWAKNEITNDIKALLAATTNAYRYNDSKNTYISLPINIKN